MKIVDKRYPDSDRPELRVKLLTPEPTRTKQSFKKECDINNIVAFYKKKGVIAHLNPAKPRYGFAPSVDYVDALQLVIDAEQSFNDLPSEVRKRFDNDPAAFLEFVENPENDAELVKLGLANAPAADNRPPEAANGGVAAEEPPPEGSP